ncbi:DegV family protein [Ureaplasma canigenitalium]|uniref:DegV family protein n=1 Tax=Ureaplasma canigenitalium TaxID=42092 RepID=UPI0004E0CD66|nr:DegV family protein [Ureaplasma canigenitalium]
MKTAILIDTGANVLDIKDENVFYIPIGLTIKEHGCNEVFKDDVDAVSQEDLKNLMLRKASIKTSLPQPGRVIEKVNELFTKYDRVIILTLSSGISGYFKSLDLVKNEFKNKNLLCLDSRSVSVGILWIVETINEALRNNENISNDEIKMIVEKNANLIKGGLIVSDLNQLVSGGRISKIKAAFAKLFGFKLFIKWDGDLEFISKAPSIRTSLKNLLDKTNELNQFRTKGIKKIVLLTDYENKEQIESLKELVIELLDIDHPPFNYSYLPGCIYAHVGVNNFAILIESNE